MHLCRVKTQAEVMMDRKRGRKADIKERKMSPAGVVQWTEYWPVNSTVACSIPSQSTKK